MLVVVVVVVYDGLKVPNRVRNAATELQDAAYGGPAALLSAGLGVNSESSPRCITDAGPVNAKKED